MTTATGKRGSSVSQVLPRPHDSPAGCRPDPPRAWLFSDGFRFVRVMQRLFQPVIIHPMSSQTDMLVAMLGRQLGLVSIEDLRGSIDVLMSSPGRALAEILVEKGSINKQAFKALMLLSAEIIAKSGGNAGTATSTLPVGDSIRSEVLACFGGPATGGPMDRSELKSRSKSQRRSKAGTTKLRRGQKDKYVFRGELGRGGISRVVEAVDTDFGREVAVKMMLPENAGGDAEPFLAEGRIAGRLPHPNIVPVYDIGILKDQGVDTPYFTMAKIEGRNLGQILLSIRNGDAESIAAFTMPRLLGIFQGICNAIEFAHDHGIIHRDLKPSNVMVGNYGEVFVVDWGLAGRKGMMEAPRMRSRAAGAWDADDTDATWESDIVGSPSYMPPEQADGKLKEIDERSDVYSLGAILYQILTLRAPFEGSSVLSVIDKVLSGCLVPPSRRVEEIRQARADSERVKVEGSRVEPHEVQAAEIESLPVNPPPSTLHPAPEDLPPHPVPAELDAMVLKAMSRRKEDRFQSVRELNAGIGRFLEGERERERDRGKASEKIAEGRALIAELDRIREELNDLELRIMEKQAEVRQHWPVERKKELWDIEARFQNLSDESVRVYSKAGRTLQAALEFDRGNAEARTALAEMYWRQFLFEEEKGNRKEMLFCENLVREYNDGSFDMRLKGDGTLAILTRHFPCRCLTEGRFVAPDELAGERVKGEGWEGRSTRAAEGDAGSCSPNPPPSTLDPSSRGVMGSRRAAKSKIAEEPAGTNPEEPLHLKVHGTECKTQPLAGADVWLFRFEERGRILLPILPSLPDSPSSLPPFHPSTLPPQVLDRLYDTGSPFRPSDGLYLGKTPIPKFRLPMGSYLIVVAYGKEDRVKGKGSGVEHKERVKDDVWKSGSKMPEEASSLDPRTSTLHPCTEHEYAPIRAVVNIGRLAEERLTVTLYREEEIPGGFVQVHGGGFAYQGDRNNPYSLPAAYRWTDDFFISKFPVTCSEYLHFLNTAAGAEKRVPRKVPTAGFYWPRDSEGRFHIPTEKWILEVSASNQVNQSPAASPAKPLPAYAGEARKRDQENQDWKRQAGKLEMSPVWWDPDWPVFGISWEDLAAYASWRTKESGRLFMLPHEVQWEKAARGVDSRIYPWGDHMDGTFCNNSTSHAGGIRPSPVGSFPVDESPFGARGMAGNAREGCLNPPGDENASFRVCRGGCWPGAPLLSRASSRTAFPSDSVSHYYGGRLAWLPALSRTEQRLRIRI